MGIAVVKYAQNSGGKLYWGVLREGNIFRLKTDYATHRGVMAACFAQRDAFLADIAEQPVAVADVVFSSPVANSRSTPLPELSALSANTTSKPTSFAW